MEFISKIIDFVITNKDIVIVVGFAIGFIWEVLITCSRADTMTVGVGVIGILGIIEVLLFGAKKFLMSLAILVAFIFAIIAFLYLKDIFSSILILLKDKLHKKD